MTLSSSAVRPKPLNEPGRVLTVPTPSGGPNAASRSKRRLVYSSRGASHQSGANTLSFTAWPWNGPKGNPLMPATTQSSLSSHARKAASAAGTASSFAARSPRRRPST